MEALLRHPQVPGSLGRVLGPGDVPVGTCFQVAPRILVTAWHVLAGLGCAGVGSRVFTDALDGSVAAAYADVISADPVRDLAVLRRAEPLTETVAGWSPTDRVRLLTDVAVTGVAVVDDPGHDYRYLQATGTWQGGTLRDGEVALGRLSSDAVVPGMSGAPVLRLADDVVVGVVSARYNSADGWLRDAVWVARTEDLAPLLAAAPEIGVHRRLVLGDVVGTVLSAAPVTPVRALDRAGAEAAVGPHEAALEAAKLLTALDSSCRGVGQLDDLVELFVSRAVGSGSERETSQLRRRLRVRGLDPRVLLPRLPEHDEALRRWADPLPGTPPEDTVSAEAARDLLTGIVRALAEELRGELFLGLSPTCRRILQAALEDGDALPLSAFPHALAERLPPLPSTSVRAVLTTSASATAGPGRHVLAAVAAQLCRLPDEDPCVAGRSELVSAVVSAIDRRMTKHQSATAFLSGQPGVGTSTVAVEAARALIPAFPGGVFHIDLYGLVPGMRRDARTVVRILSEALGHDTGSATMDDDALFAAFAARVRGRRILLVLDNAFDAAHVRPLVRAVSGCAVIVTSRNRNQGYADPGSVFEVRPLSRAASVDVLRRCGEGRDDDAALLHRLAALCGDVPLALRVVGARMANRPDLDLGYLVQVLDEEAARLDYLEDGDRAVRLAIQLSYDALEPPARRAFRLITAAPGSAVSGPELGHCLNAPAFRQELLLNRLVDRSLAQQEVLRLPAGNLLATFILFDLVRLFAKERLEEEEPAEVVKDFQHRSVSYLCGRLTEITDQSSTAHLAGELDPGRFHAAQYVAEHNGWLDLATELALGLHILYSARGELGAIVSVNETRVSLLLRLGRPEEAVKVCLLNADTLRSARATGPAADAARQAAGLAREHQLPHLVAEAEFKLSVLLWEQQRWQAAVAAGERAVSILTAVGRGAAAVPIAINNARMAREAEDTAGALRWAGTATELADRWGDTDYRAMALNQRGLAEEDADDSRAAVETYCRAAALWESISNWNHAANDYDNAAAAAGHLEDPAGAVHLRERAAELWDRGQSHARLVEALVDLSVTHARAGDDGEVSSALDRAEQVCVAHEPVVPELLRDEVSVRRQAARLRGSSHAEQPTVPRPPMSDQADDIEAARQVLRRHHAGSLTTRQANRELRSLLTTSTHNRIERPDAWVYEEMGAEAGDRPELGRN